MIVRPELLLSCMSQVVHVALCHTTYVYYYYSYIYRGYNYIYAVMYKASSAKVALRRGTHVSWRDPDGQESWQGGQADSSRLKARCPESRVDFGSSPRRYRGYTTEFINSVGIPWYMSIIFRLSP